MSEKKSEKPTIPGIMRQTRATVAFNQRIDSCLLGWVSVARMDPTMLYHSV